MEAVSDEREGTGGARAWPLLALLALGFLAFNAATLLLPHDPYARYQQLLPTIQFRAVWGYERTVFDKTPIDVAVVGNSRLGAGVSAPQLQQQLSAALGRNVNVANLSMPQEGQNTHYVIAKRLLEHHPEVKLIILSAIGQMPREGHPAFRNLADARDVVGAPILLNADYANDLAFLPWRQISLFVQGLFPATFGIHDFAGSAYDGPGYDTTASFRTPTGNYVDRDSIHSDAELRGQADARAATIDAPQLPELHGAIRIRRRMDLYPGHRSPCPRQRHPRRFSLPPFLRPPDAAPAPRLLRPAGVDRRSGFHRRAPGLVFGLRSSQPARIGDPDPLAGRDHRQSGLGRAG